MGGQAGNPPFFHPQGSDFSAFHARTALVFRGAYGYGSPRVPHAFRDLNSPRDPTYCKFNN